MRSARDRLGAAEVRVPPEDAEVELNRVEGLGAHLGAALVHRDDDSVAILEAQHFQHALQEIDEPRVAHTLARVDGSFRARSLAAVDGK